MVTKSLKERIERLEAVHEIENLINRYEYKLQVGLYDEVVELFAQKTPGVRAELPPGAYEGIEGIRRLYKVLHKREIGDYHSGIKPGFLFIQVNTTRLLEVAGDGKTAKGLWISFGPTTMPFEGKLTAHWLWTKRGYDFVKEDGKWKIWHYHVYNIFYTPYHISWVDLKNPETVGGMGEMSDEVKPDRAPTYSWTYRPTATVEYVPAAPEPYETFDEKTAY